MHLLAIDSVNYTDSMSHFYSIEINFVATYYVIGFSKIADTVVPTLSKASIISIFDSCETTSIELSKDSFNKVTAFSISFK